MAAANHAPVDLAELVTDIGELYEPAAREKSMSLRVAAIARLHHAQLLLEDNEPGLRVRLGLAAGLAAGA